MPLFETDRKTQGFGSSLAITIPSLFSKVNELKKGSMLKVFYNLEGVLIVSCSDDKEVLTKCMKTFIDSLNDEIMEERARAAERA